MPLRAAPAGIKQWPRSCAAVGLLCPPVPDSPPAHHPPPAIPTLLLPPLPGAGELCAAQPAGRARAAGRGPARLPRVPAVRGGAGPGSVRVPGRPARAAVFQPDPPAPLAPTQPRTHRLNHSLTHTSDLPAALTAASTPTTPMTTWTRRRAGTRTWRRRGRRRRSETRPWPPAGPAGACEGPAAVGHAAAAGLPASPAVRLLPAGARSPHHPSFACQPPLQRGGDMERRRGRVVEGGRAAVGARRRSASGPGSRMRGQSTPQHAATHPAPTNGAGAARRRARRVGGHHPLPRPAGGREPGWLAGWLAGLRGQGLGTPLARAGPCSQRQALRACAPCKPPTPTSPNPAPAPAANRPPYNPCSSTPRWPPCWCSASGIGRRR